MPSITFNGLNIHAEENTSLSILELLEQQGVATNSQCRNGICGTCRCKLNTGKVEYIKEPLAFLHHDEILICIAKVSGILVIKNSNT